MASACMSGASSARAACGKRTTTTVPAPSTERMRIRPPCSSASDLAIARPRPGSLVPFGQLAFHLLERPAQLVQRILRDADAVVLDGNGARRRARPPAHGHRAAVGREFHRVGKKVERNLLEGAAIGLELHACRNVGTKRQTLFIGAPEDDRSESAMMRSSSTVRDKGGCRRPRSSTCRECH